MGGGFTFATPSSAVTPPFAAAGSFPTGSQPHYFSENDSVFGPVPSRVEVENAIIELQRFMSSLPNNKSEVEAVDGQIHHHYHHSPMLQSDRFTKFSEAWAMMQAEPPLQNLVVAISCDKAVWEAIKKNEAIHDLYAGKCEVPWHGGEEEKYDELTDAIMRWIMRFTKYTIGQLVEKFVSLVNEMFQVGAKGRGGSSQMLDDKVGSSFLLSLVILVIVVVTRAYG